MTAVKEPRAGDDCDGAADDCTGTGSDCIVEFASVEEYVKLDVEVAFEVDSMEKVIIVVDVAPDGVELGRLDDGAGLDPPIIDETWSDVVLFGGCVTIK